MRDDAWREYANLPRFHRRHERPFAWRLEPWRPAGVLAVVILAAIVGSCWILPSFLGGAAS